VAHHAVGQLAQGLRRIGLVIAVLARAVGGAEGHAQHGDVGFQFGLLREIGDQLRIEQGLVAGAGRCGELFHGWASLLKDPGGGGVATAAVVNAL
jgi:hypothetical protein